jgi:mannose-6-phosphate isomerase-like protein (cupin superfamily)
MTAIPVIAGPDEGERLFFGGGLLHLKVTSEQSDGAYLLLEDDAPRGKTTPLHLHEHCDETFYVIDGELLIHIDGTERTAGPGAIAAIPRGTPHAFMVTSESARWLAFITPGEIAERFMRDGGVTPSSPDEPVPPLDIARVRTAGERTGGMTFLGPPPFAELLQKIGAR